MEPHLTDDQLDEIFLRSASDAKGPAAGRPDLVSVSMHLADCEECQERLRKQEAMMRRLADLRVEHLGERHAECPPEEIWIEIAAAVLDRDSEQYLEHAAKCDHCGPLLREATDTVSYDSSADEEAFLDSLTSSRTDWQRRLAQTLSMEAGAALAAPKPAALKRVFFLPKLAIAFAAVVLVGCGAWLTALLLRPKPVEQLLAEAYSEHRTLEVRIPRAKYSALHVERGTTSNLEKPVSLLRAEALISERLKADPTDPNWLDQRGRAELLDGNYDAAVNTLTHALHSNSESFSLLADLGAAYYMRGESTDSSLDFGKSIEFLSRALKNKPDDLVVRYNHALACEKYEFISAAIEDWEIYLREDPSSDWTPQVREHLQRDRQMQEQHHIGALTPLLGPVQFSAAVASSSGSTETELNSRYERYQHLALQSWLPEAIRDGFASPSSEPFLHAVQSLGQLLKEGHDDPWIAELLSAPRTLGLGTAIGLELSSDDAIANGQYDQALQLAKQSELQFEKMGNRPGALWAKFSAMEARDSALAFADCVRDENGALQQLNESGYHWLEAAMLIEQGECLAGLARLGEAIENNRMGREMAERYHFPALELRAAAFGAKYLLSTGRREEGLSELRSGLTKFWESDVPEAPGENLYACLFNPADDMDWPFIDAFALKELLTSFPPKDRVDLAVERELLGEAEMRGGQYREAREDLETAVEALSSVPDQPGVAFRRAQIGVKDAQILLRLGETEKAIDRLAPFRQQFEGASPGRFQAEFFKTLGEGYLYRGDVIDAQPLLERAIAVRETGLENLTPEADKLAWGRARGELYRDMLEIKLKRDTPAEALAWWEWYKGASLRSSRSAESSLLENFSRSADAQTHTFLSTMAPESALISYAMLRESIAVFVARGGIVHVYTLPREADLDDAIRQLLSLCADSSADFNALNRQGRLIYQKLIEPLDPQIQGTTSLRIETDGVVDSVPFNLLLAADGSYLGDRKKLGYSQGILFDAKSKARVIEQPLSPFSAVLIVISPGGTDSSLPLLSDVGQEGSEVASHFNRAVLISGSSLAHRTVIKDLQDAEVFHFAGHMIDSGNHTGLVLRSGEVLTASDFADLHLRNLRLAVLSACDSAIGGEGTIADADSVTRALIASGVPHVVASRWRVDSEVTQQWMKVFYSELMAGKSPADSVLTAANTIRSDPAHRHPYYWASFAVFGEP